MIEDHPFLPGKMRLERKQFDGRFCSGLKLQEKIRSRGKLPGPPKAHE
jgi:hypothetical protein